MKSKQEIKRSRIQRRRIKLYQQSPFCPYCHVHMILPEDVAAQQGISLKELKQQPPNMCTIEHIFSRPNPRRGTEKARPTTIICCHKCNHERGVKDLQKKQRRDNFMRKIKTISSMTHLTEDRECKEHYYNKIRLFTPIQKYVRAIMACILLCTGLVMAQTPYYIMRPFEYQVADTIVRVQGVSLKNTWVNSKLSIPLKDDGLLRQNIVFGAKVLYTPIFGDDWAFPIVGAFAPGNSDPFVAESGLNLGIYPYKVLSETRQRIFILHGGLGYKSILREVVTDPVLDLWSGVLGVEWLFYQVSSTGPTTLSLTGNIWQSPDDFFFGAEATSIIPVGGDLGLMIEYTQAVGRVGGVRIGIIKGT